MKLILLHSAQRELDKLPDSLAFRISNKILALAKNPRPQGSEKLRGKKGYRLRMGDYRIIYLVDKKNKVIVIVKIGHRREVYR